MIITEQFLLTRPLRDVTISDERIEKQTLISTHTPIAGGHTSELQSRTPSGISTHTPLAGRDLLPLFDLPDLFISTHTPLAGRDSEGSGEPEDDGDFYSHAPCGT